MATILSENHDISSINFVAGLSDPGEMIRCGYLPQLRRHANEADREYAERIRPMVMALSKGDRDRIMGAAIARAGLDTSNGRVNVFVAGESAWHALGINVESAVSTIEAIKLAGLDWQVEQRKLTAWKIGTMEFDIPDKVANFRSDTGAYLATVGSNWKPLQNHEAFSFMDEVLESGGAHWETAGSLAGGKRVWMLAQLNNSFDVVPGDEVKAYGLICMGHDGSMAIRVMPTTERVVCANTLNAAMTKADERKLCIRHGLSMKGKVEAAKQCLGIVSKRIDTFAEEARGLAGRHMRGQEVREYYERFFPTQVKPTANVDGASLLDQVLSNSNEELVADLLAGHYAETERIAKRNAVILEHLLENFEDKSNSIPGMAGTAWAAFNGLSELVDHKEYRSADARMHNVVFGSGDQLKQQAFAAAKELANAV